MKNTKAFISSFLIIIILAYLVISNIGNSNYKYDYSTVENDPLNTLIYTLDNGLKIYMSVNNDEPRIQTNIAVNTGSKQDPSDATGLAHYLEHMLFKGTSEMGTVNWNSEKGVLEDISDLYEMRRSVVDQEERKVIYHKIDSLSLIAANYAVPNEYDKMISSLGAKGTNAYTSLERTVYVNDIPSNELEKWLMIESERFSELVLRLFHTELETVYEEFNRGQDNDNRLVWSTMMKNMFKKHSYGTQTTIGTSEHLKNPSMEKIHEYFNQRYVPNNMAIILAGDLDPDKTVDLIKKHFGSYVSKDVPEFIPPVEDPIVEPEIVNVQGSDAAWVTVGFRMPGIDHEDAYLLQLMDGLLSNGQAGLIDLNLVKSQKVLNGYSQYMYAKDYSLFQLVARPREGQTLDEARSLLLNELEKIKNGDFEEWMIKAVVKNFKLDDLNSNEYNSSRTYKMTDAFILDQDWEKVVNKYQRMNDVTKQDIIDFSNKYFSNNYIVVNKLTGESNSIKVEKPQISTLPINRDTSSLFAAKFNSIKSSRLTPVYNDYSKEITKKDLSSNIPLYYVNNTSNEVFTLSYILDMGEFSDLEMSLAVKYLQYLGTDQYSSSEIEREMYKLGLSYSVNVAEERVYVSLSGLEESLEDGIKLFEHILSNVQSDQIAYDNMVLDMIKQRGNNKLSKGYISYGMREYAKYGDESPFKNMISSKDLESMDIEKLVKKIKQLTSYQHYIYYYGKKNLKDVCSIIEKYHFSPKDLLPLLPPKKFKELDHKENNVYFTNYDMVQTEISMISRVTNYNQDLIAPARIFNQYFGSGLSSIVFQEIREAKALAYSAYSYFSSPRKLDDSHYVFAYLGTQVDKLGEATESLLDLMNNMPEVQDQFEDAKTAAMKKIETSRTKKSDLFWQFLAAKKMNRDYDINRDIYSSLEQMDINQLKLFFDNNIKGRNYTFCVIGNQNLVDHNKLKDIGQYQELTLEEIFGY